MRPRGRASLFLARRASLKTGRVNNSQAKLWLIPLGACVPAACLGACSALSGAASYGPASVDARSSAAEAVTAAGHARHPYPDLRRLPKPPPLTPPAAYAARAQEQRTARSGLQRWVAANPAEASDTEAYAGAQRGRVLDPAREAPSDNQAARSEAWAARLRQAAKPPPPPSL